MCHDCVYKMLTMSAQLTQLSLEYDCFVVGFFV